MNLFFIFSIIHVTIASPLFEEFIFRLWIKKGGLLHKISFLIFIFDLFYLIPRYFIDINVLELNIFNFVTSFLTLDYTSPQINTFFDFRNAFIGFYVYIVFIPAAIILSRFSFISKIYDYTIKNLNSLYLILITATIFTLSHSHKIINIFSNGSIFDFLYYIIFLFVGGIIFAIVRLKYGFRYVVCLHIVFNSMSLLINNLL